ncbi:uncharacterized protein LOC131171317 isoform X2 [Hevea brasiliensis]|uniref:uncharacterized protein LOC131171317 isoform X2 n=1 Tax=Hevea brasiliensis TaxID=3981 RepID=UPI0025E45C2F|nr:uncharacterized protein LOC131171317 isoform X2 [Hevea brasiliensis]XP_057987035.1 uncharacterized protein LOC131171317 isoform X2 [Hevea brasiliensis]XP_057987036.1 uncharacterized protein LOC131171317 isoform X2 [Hevea brasiliensis]XP_057987037.1 uncharacterized protein LOC131171317 isoform X2 [Hevea brasiliensis]XP_057987038.1 uncharacterized protein LOC131171317 isoform X2 [Hevea brasiliensis]XP_057987039.1 uncharacterized protein LOC131171317 isoform X2 [Hevea brasiliensis]
MSGKSLCIYSSGVSEQLRKRIQLRKQQMGASCLKQSNEVRRLFSLIPFSLEDRYQILPKMIPWDFPSWLSELVEKEITMLLCMMEKSGVFTEVIEDKFDDKDIQNYFEKHIYEIDSIEAKKKAMLSKNCFDHDSILQTPQFHSFGEAARELLILKVMTECQEVLTRILALNFSLKMMTNFPPVIQPCKKADAHQLTCNFVPSQKLEESHYLCSETVVHLNVKYKCISVDLSYVPELSYVLGTENNDGTKLLFGKVSCA